MVPVDQSGKPGKNQDRGEIAPATIKLSSILEEGLILCGMRARGKCEAVEELASFVAEKEPGVSKEAIVESVLARERACTTAIGRRSAFPHGEVAGLGKMIVAVGMSEAGVDFDAIDGLPVNFIVLIVTSETAASEYLGTLAAFASLSRDQDKMEVLLRAGSPAEVLRTIESFDIEIM
jgi:mannitol/fructose-specific phosphotransferase system IIA component (Ntr-type)